jgi:hypothetical protein
VLGIVKSDPIEVMNPMQPPVVEGMMADPSSVTRYPTGPVTDRLLVEILWRLKPRMNQKNTLSRRATTGRQCRRVRHRTFEPAGAGGVGPDKHLVRRAEFNSLEKNLVRHSYLRRRFLKFLASKGSDL